MTEDLIAWLRAQLDEDAALIERNSGQRGITDEGIFPDYRTYDGEDLNAADAYLVGFNPKRMLAEVDAKRRILDDIVPLIDHLDADLQAELPGGRREATGQSDDLLRLLALPYADRSGYREEWRP